MLDYVIQYSAVFIVSRHKRIIVAAFICYLQKNIFNKTLQQFFMKLLFLTYSFSCSSVMSGFNCFSCSYLVVFLIKPHRFGAKSRSAMSFTGVAFTEQLRQKYLFSRMLKHRTKADGDLKMNMMN